MIFQSSVRLTYETILTELEDIEKKSKTSSSNANQESPEQCSSVVLIKILTQLIIFIQARLQMLSLYDNIF